MDLQVSIVHGFVRTCRHGGAALALLPDNLSTHVQSLVSLGERALEMCV